MADSVIMRYECHTGSYAACRYTQVLSLTLRIGKSGQIGKNKERKEKGGRDIFLVVPCRPADVSPPAIASLRFKRSKSFAPAVPSANENRAFLAFFVSRWVYYSHVWLKAQVSICKFV